VRDHGVGLALHRALDSLELVDEAREVRRARRRTVRCGQVDLVEWRVQDGERDADVARAHALDGNARLVARALVVGHAPDHVDDTRSPARAPPAHDLRVRAAAQPGDDVHRIVGVEVDDHGRFPATVTPRPAAPRALGVDGTTCTL
jgi:hypothetical protein